jgi:hypothetical protein
MPKKKVLKITTNTRKKKFKNNPKGYFKLINLHYRSGSGSALIKNAGSVSALSQCGSTTLLVTEKMFYINKYILFQDKEEKKPEPLPHAIPDSLIGMTSSLVLTLANSS